MHIPCRTNVATLHQSPQRPIARNVYLTYLLNCAHLLKNKNIKSLITYLLTVLLPQYFQLNLFLVTHSIRKTISPLGSVLNYCTAIFQALYLAIIGYTYEYTHKSLPTPSGHYTDRGASVNSCCYEAGNPAQRNEHANTRRFKNFPD